jgi:hypothetical protein
VTDELGCNCRDILMTFPCDVSFWEMGDGTTGFSHSRVVIAKAISAAFGGRNALSLICKDRGIIWGAGKAGGLELLPKSQSNYPLFLLHT